MALFDMDNDRPVGRTSRTRQDIGPFDALIRAAGGEALPGTYGLAQAILNVWTGQAFGNPYLVTAKRALNTVGVVRKYREASTAQDEKIWTHPIQDYLIAHKLEVPKDLKMLGSMIFAHTADLPHEDFVPARRQNEDGKGENASFKSGFLRRFRLPSGTTFYYEMWCDNHNKPAHPYGPYITAEGDAPFREQIAQVIWNANGGKDLQLAIRHVHDTYDRVRFALENIGDPGDYVSGKGTWRSIEKLSDRIFKLREHNISRNILLYGPPGTGKTTLARKLARKIGGGNTLRIELAAITHAGTESLMQFIELLRPKVLLFDDIDRNLDEVLEVLHLFEQIGAETTSFSDPMVVIATVNALSTIDPALLRPGRFDEVIEISEPDDDFRLAIIDHYLERFDLDLSTKERDGLHRATKGFAPADLREVIQCVSAVGVEHLEDEIARVARQRMHYAGDACDRHLNPRYKALRPDPSDELLPEAVASFLDADEI